MTNNASANNPAFVESVRERADLTTDADAPLDFYSIALEMGASARDAERIDERLTARVMRARGAI